VVDQLFIGNSSIGYMGNVATTVVFPLTILALALSLFIGDGMASYLALCQGKKDTRKASKAISVALLFTRHYLRSFYRVCLIWMDPILRYLGATDGSLPLAREYGLIVLGGVVFSFYTNVLNPIIRNDGAPIFAMIAQGAGRDCQHHLGSSLHLSFSIRVLPERLTPPLLAKRYRRFFHSPISLRARPSAFLSMTWSRAGRVSLRPCRLGFPLSSFRFRWSS
jgi:hypothetical protein